MTVLIKKLLLVETLVVAVTLIAWMATGDGRLFSLSIYLFRMGVGSITLGIIIVMGAGVGTRTETVAYLKPGAQRRLLGDMAHRKRSYSVLNLLAMAGFIAIIMAIVLRKLATQ